MNFAFERGGHGDRLLVLLHGLGTTWQVWHPLLQHGAAQWSGRWVVPDLRGHGASQGAPPKHSLGFHAADVAALVNQSAPPWSELVILGHSMGGAVALALASGWFGFTPERVFGLGIKVAWSPEELAKLREFSASPVRTFVTKDEAVARYLKVAGLQGLVSPESEIAQSGVMEEDGAWRLAANPATASVGPPPMPGLMAAAQCPIHLARGETDALVTLDQLKLCDPNAVNIAGAGHNAMVEKPDAVWAWLMSKRG
jgi:pimeloyl-ACP methyl ester carboxylesterase